ncbi:aspartate aminotransferase [Nostoc sp. WHI]|uniref:aspartate aminotransferase n=1 Tax=Nostoc sp. WHI TaxID=2650611 RepID=UPI0018C4BF3D|nr:aspartate aminotransferase [Nostoc sp. WHI]MBG1270136.1 aspartate aminotransferase [Nostoc sp. WHI]
MFEIRLQETRVYQEAKEEGRQEGIKLGIELEIKQVQEEIEQGRQEVKRELIPRCLAYGISIEEVAKLFDLTIEQVEQIRLASEQESSTLT